MMAHRDLDARGLIGIGVYALVLLVLVLMWLSPALRNDEFFKTIATLIVGAFIKDVVGWAYQATKGGGELADKNAAIVAESATANVALAAALPAVVAASEPQKVEVVNTADNPAVTTDAAAVEDNLPEYAR